MDAKERYHQIFEYHVFPHKIHVVRIVDPCKRYKSAIIFKKSPLFFSKKKKPISKIGFPVCIHENKKTIQSHS